MRAAWLAVLLVALAASAAAQPSASPPAKTAKPAVVQRNVRPAWAARTCAKPRPNTSRGRRSSARASFPRPQNPAARSTSVAPSLARRLASMLYEALLVFAVAFFAAWIFFFASGGRDATRGA